MLASLNYYYMFQIKHFQLKIKLMQVSGLLTAGLWYERDSIMTRPSPKLSHEVKSQISLESESHFPSQQPELIVLLETMLWSTIQIFNNSIKIRKCTYVGT